MYGDSQALFTDPNGIFPLSLKAKQGLTAKSKELLMASEAASYGGSQADSGLLRFRSAPGSLFANLTDEKSGGVVHGEGFSRFSSSGAAAKCSIVSQSSSAAELFMDDDDDDDDDDKGLINGYGVNSQLPPQYPRQSGASQAGFMGMEHFDSGQPKMSSGLMRQNSSPAGLFQHLTSQNDYATLGGPGNYRMVNGSSGDLGPGSTRLKGQVNYSSGLWMLSRISEVANENAGATEADDEKLGADNGEAPFYASGFPFGSWNESANFGESFPRLKREIDGDEKLFPDSQNAEIRRPPMLSHHLSLPKSSAEITAVEKLLRFQDTVPCKIRAKRGCATHPRSIAERVRRTRISERMRKLQELVPNMDKQTNTADMLDLAVEYIKELQRQHKAFTDIRAKCKCSGMQNAVPHLTS